MTHTPIQPGWRLVPEEPTEEMILAGHRQIDWCRNDQNTERPHHPSQVSVIAGMTAGSTCGQDLRDAWRAAIAAAPQPPAPKRWYLGTMNDGLFIIDTPPRPSTDDVVHDRTDGPTMILNVTDLPHAKAQAIVDAHNAAPQPPTPDAVEGLNDLPGRLRDALARAEKAEAERDEARANLQIANTGGLNLLYDIRKAIGWTDKHALSLLPDECARLKKAGSRNASIWPGKNYDYSQPGKFDGPTGAD